MKKMPDPKNRAAKRHTSRWSGSLFASYKVQPLCQNVWLRIVLTSHFIKQIATLLRGIFVIPFFAVVGLLFFSHCDQRKEAKERRLIRTDIFILLKPDDYLLLKYSWAISATPTLKYLLPLHTPSMAFLKSSASLPISR